MLHDEEQSSADVSTTTHPLTSQSKSTAIIGRPRAEADTNGETTDHRQQIVMRKQGKPEHTRRDDKSNKYVLDNSAEIQILQLHNVVVHPHRDDPPRVSSVQPL